MKRRMIGLAAGILFLGAVAGGCVDNVEVCQEWAASMDCGGVDFEEAVSCEDYQRRHCYLYDYFDCLTDNTTCDEASGTVDTSLWRECEPLDCG